MVHLSILICVVSGCALRQSCFAARTARYLTSNEYAVQSGANTFTVRFTAGAENYSCLELGGLGAFELTFTGLGIQEVS